MALIVSNTVLLNVLLPRPKGKTGAREASLPVAPSGTGKGPPPRLTAVLGVMIGAPDLDQRDAERAFQGWRLHVLVDNAPLIDGAPLSRVYTTAWESCRPVRDANEQVVMLTPRDPAHVDVAVGVEWRGKGKPRRLPKNVTVRIMGVD